MVHGNAQLTPKGRLKMVRRVKAGNSKSRVAREMWVSRECVRKWVNRYDTEGEAGLLDRSSRPHTSPRRVAPETERAVVDARRRLRAGPARVAAATGVAERTVTRILRRNGVPRLWDCDPLTGEPKQPVRKGLGIRYERTHPGELLHMDTKKIAAIPLGGGWAVHGRGNVAQQGVGYVFVHSIVDDYTRLAYSEPLPDEKAPTVVRFLTRALENLQQHGIHHVRAIMTDNHWSYKRSLLFQALLKRHGIKHITIKPYNPQQNGKVERYHLTLKREWINQQAWPDEETRTQALHHWLHHYNNHRPHTSLGGQPPTTRLQPT